MIDVLNYCNSFYHAHYIPVSYFDTEKRLVVCFPEQLACLGKLLDRFEETDEVGIFYATGFSIFYKIELGNENGSLVFGPFCTSKPNQQEMKDFLDCFAISQENTMLMEQSVRQIPITSINQSLFILDQAYTAVKQEQINIFERFGFVHPSQQSIQEDLTDQLYDAKEEARHHNTYYFEKRLIQAVKTGNVQKLHELLVYQDQAYHAGQLSDNLLRQLKNIFIIAITQTVRAAIEGGLSIEKAYQLSDIYINKCEHMTDEASIYGLSYTMYMDFVQRVADCKIQSRLSQPVQQALNYIQTHTNLPLNVQMVADHVGFSYSFFSKQFKQETEKTINEAILEAKMEEAMELLAFTDKPISHISTYLAFSSQSYFQNQFKKFTGQTPLHYRKDKR